MTVPLEISRRVQEILNSTWDEFEIRTRFPDVIDFFNQNVSLVDLMAEAGVKLTPISADAPGIFVGECPFCSSGPFMVRSS